MAKNTAIEKHDARMRSWFLMKELVSKDFKLRYRRSVLGVLWSVLNPLLMMIVMVLIFTNIFRWTFDAYSFPVYVTLGQVLFTVFQDSTTDSMSSIVVAAPLIKKVRIEKIVFPTSKCLFAFVNFLFSLLAVALVMLVCATPPSWKLVLLPVLLIEMLFFCLGISYLISSMAVYFRDVMHFWGVITTIFFYFTPIFWPYDALANNGISWVYTLIQFNPMYHYVSAFRQMSTGIPLPSDIGILPELAIGAGFAAITFLVGLLVFKKLEKKFILYI
mgnify:CR=1 FL=1